MRLGRWRDWELDVLRTHYATGGSAVCMQYVDRSPRAIHLKARQLGLSAPPAGQFPPGNAPWNKGLKGWAADGTQRTQFKPGERRGRAADHWQPVGTLRETADGYIEQKVADTMSAPTRLNWRPVHHLVWEQHHGTIPTGCVVVFRDGNQSNLAPDNLECITRAELMNRNSIHTLPSTLRSLCRVIGRLDREIKKESKHDTHTPASG